MSKTFLFSNATLMFYIKTLVFSLILFAVLYAYTSWLKIPNVLNKSVADAAIILIGLSMLMSGLAYFWNLFDSLVIYRKYLGLVGWAFGLTHLLLSWSAFLALFKAETWQNSAAWPAFTGLVATVIFTIMAVISNSWMARALGGRAWRFILRTGYVGVLLVLAHVVLLKWGRWVTWYEQGMKTFPSTSLIVSVFMVIVVAVRIALALSLMIRSKRSVR